MIIIPINESDTIERALKRYKKKFEKTGVIRELRERQQFTKPSIIKRNAKQKAIYVRKMQDEEM